VEVTGLVVGEVDEMSFEDGSASPSVDGVPIDLASILRLYSAADE